MIARCNSAVVNGAETCEGNAKGTLSRQVFHSPRRSHSGRSSARGAGTPNYVPALSLAAAWNTIRSGGQGVFGCAFLGAGRILRESSISTER